MKNISRESQTKSVETHQASIRKSLEHRLDVARAQGNLELIQVLEAEYRQVT